MNINDLSRDELLLQHCLEKVDVVPGELDTTEFKRRARLKQALWRQAQELPIGSEPMRAGDRSKSTRPLGSRIDVSSAELSLSNFLTDGAKNAVRDRIKNSQPQQTLNMDRLYCDLLSSMPMCFNLFGPLFDNFEAIDRAIKHWWQVPGKATAMRFEWSPARATVGEYLENRSAFDVAFEFALPEGGIGIVGVETKYHEHCKNESAPSKDRQRRYQEVTKASGVFKPEAFDAILGTPLQQIWLDHLLALSMLQHPNLNCRWVKFVLVHPSKNPSYARAYKLYEQLLVDTSTVELRTIESLLDEKVLPANAIDAFSNRYLW